MDNRAGHTAKPRRVHQGEQDEVITLTCILYRLLVSAKL